MLIVTQDKNSSRIINKQFKYAKCIITPSHPGGILPLSITRAYNFLGIKYLRTEHYQTNHFNRALRIIIRLFALIAEGS
jgi:hypothetical protein